jgi:hypothetical protein
MNHGIHGTHGRERGWWRSRLFWLGMPGLMFLLWGWFAIPRTTATLTWRGVDGYVTLGHASRLAYCYFVPSLEKVPPRWQRGATVSTAILEPERTNAVFPRAIQFDLGRRGGFNVFVAYWFLIFMYLPLWLGALAVSQRRRLAR